MITILACDNCLNIMRVVGDDDDTRRLIHKHAMWKDGWPCFNEGCVHKMYLVSPDDVEGVLAAAKTKILKIHDVSPTEAFQALCGFGLPEEVGTDIEVVRSLFLSSKVVDVCLRRGLAGKTIIENISLENGLRVHLASSSAGPTVFKITRKQENEKSR